MSLTTQNRVHRGVPAGGQFAGHDRDESDIRLVPDTIASQRDWLDRNGFSLPAISEAEFDVRLSRLGRPVTDLDRAEVFRAVHREHLGFDPQDASIARDAALLLRCQGRQDLADAVDRLTRAATRSVGLPTAEDAIPYAAETVARAPYRVRSANSNGEPVVFAQRGEHEIPDEPTAVRVQVDRHLKEDEQARLDDLVRYALNAAHRDAAGESWNDSPSSAVVNVNLAEGRTRSRDTERFDLFERRIKQLLLTGSEVRTTDRSGRGTRGTRAIEPWQHAPRFVVYYDKLTTREDG